MALTRSFLKGMGLTDEQVGAIIEAHVETTDGLKAQLTAYKADAESYKDVKAELDELKSKGGDWESKYNEEHTAFEAYKTEQTTKETRAAKVTAYKGLLKDVGVSEKRIDTVIKATDIDGLELDAKGMLKDADSLKESAADEWKDFIVTTSTPPANVSTPPATNGGTITKEQFDKMGYIERNELYNSDKALYESLSKG